MAGLIYSNESLWFINKSEIFINKALSIKYGIAKLFKFKS